MPPKEFSIAVDLEAALTVVVQGKGEGEGSFAKVVGDADVVFPEIKSHVPGSTDSGGKWTTDNRTRIAIFFVGDFAGPVFRGEITSYFGVAFEVALELFKLIVEGALVAGSDPIKVRV